MRRVDEVKRTPHLGFGGSFGPPKCLDNLCSSTQLSLIQRVAITTEIKEGER